MNRENLLRQAYESFKDNPVFPYHNFLHCVETAHRTFLASFYYGLKEEVREILYEAALFHDARYLGDKDDTKNVLHSAEATENPLVKELIVSTASPWLPPKENDPHKLLKEILHDCDILQSATIHWRILLEEELGTKSSLDWLKENLTTAWGREYLTVVAEAF